MRSSRISTRPSVPPGPGRQPGQIGSCCPIRRNCEIGSYGPTGSTAYSGQTGYY
jgi:hypothetical protein